MILRKLKGSGIYETEWLVLCYVLDKGIKGDVECAQGPKREGRNDSITIGPKYYKRAENRCAVMFPL